MQESIEDNSWKYASMENYGTMDKVTNHNGHKHINITIHEQCRFGCKQNGWTLLFREIESDNMICYCTTIK